LISRRTGKHVSLLPTDRGTKRLLGKILQKIGGLSFVTDPACAASWRIMGAVAHHPGLAGRLVFHVSRLIACGRVPWKIIVDLVRGQAHTFGIGMHNFMDAEQVSRAGSDPVIRARLEACVFKGAVKENGEWHAVPMCRMNQQKWSEIYDQRLHDSALIRQRQGVETSAAQSRASEENPRE
jgi:hypothetical protein